MEKLFQELPKPSNLHVHFSTFVPYDVILKDIKKNKDLRDRLYISSTQELNFCKNRKKNMSYKLITEQDIDKIEKLLKRKDKLKTFVLLGGIFYGIIKNFDYYKNFYLKHILSQMKLQKIQYIEFRLRLGSCIDQHGKNIPIIEELEALYPYRKHFRIIVQDNKSKEKDSLHYFQNIIDLVRGTKYESIICGYDFVGSEDKKKSFFQQHFHALQNFKKKNHIQYYLHAGEVPNQPTSVTNLDYAIRLNPIRIGHGINLFKHPHLWKDIQKKNIYLENCPISNYVFFKYHLDIQNIIQYIDQIVIGSDDDNKFGSNLSMDYFYLHHLGLEMKYIYQLLLNSGKFVPHFNKKEFDKHFLIFYKKYLKLKKK